MEVRVPRSRVVEEGNYVQYELCTRGVTGCAEAASWRRFNEFKQLDAALRSDPAAMALDLPQLPSASFFARCRITSTDVDERRDNLQSYVQEVVGRVGESSELLRDFLALDKVEQAGSTGEESAPLATKQPSESIDVPPAAARSDAHACPGSPYAISPPDSCYGDAQTEVFDLASWVLLEDSDDEDEVAKDASHMQESGQSTVNSPQRTAGGAAVEANSASSEIASNDLGAGTDTPALKHEKDQAANAASSVATKAATRPARRSYAAAARASLLVGEALPPEPTKLQIVSWLHRNSSPQFLRERSLTGHPRAIANARSREELADAYYLALVAKVPVDKLEGLIFDTMDSDLDERVNRNELRYSPFEPTLGPAWDQIAKGKHHIERSDWKRYVEAAKTKVGGAVEKFLADLVFEADVDVAHLLPPMAVGGNAS